MKPIAKIELNQQFKQALKIMENTSKNVFVTGKAGTGKSTLLEYFRSTTKKKVVVLAPTGVAAINVAGQTVHSFFGFKPNITLQKIRRKYKKDDKNNIYKKLDAIIIDEISMVRSDLLDCVDKFLRLNGKNKNLAFGGAQMIFIGDLYQLPPVVISKEREIFAKEYNSEYFFDAKVFNDDKFVMKFIELEKIYRQNDQKFINLLNAIRNNSITEQELKIINACYNPNFQNKPGDFFICLTPTNKASQIINEEKLYQLNNKLYNCKGTTTGDFKKEYLPTEIDLRVKAGAQIMMLNNDSIKRWVNGTIGKIVEIQKNKETGLNVIFAKLANGEIEAVLPHTWEIFNFSLDKNTGMINSKIVGSFTQYPLKLAWSVTIHKSQGKTFDNVIIDIGRGTFAHGQMYVALSRCTTLDGIVLKKQISKKNIWMDWRVVKFMTKYQYEISEKNLSLEDKIQIIKNAISSKSELSIVYLKANDTKSKRIIRPKQVGQMEYLNKPFLGMNALCLTRKEDRVFRVDRILEMKVVSN